MQAQVLQYEQPVGELAQLESDAGCQQGGAAAASHQEQEDYQP